MGFIDVITTNFKYSMQIHPRVLKSRFRNKSALIYRGVSLSHRAHICICWHTKSRFQGASLKQNSVSTQNIVNKYIVCNIFSWRIVELAPTRSVPWTVWALNWSPQLGASTTPFTDTWMCTWFVRVPKTPPNCYVNVFFCSLATTIACTHPLHRPELGEFLTLHLR